MSAIKNIKQKRLVNFLEAAAAWEFLIFSGNPGATMGIFTGYPRGIIVMSTCLALWAIKSNKRFNSSFGVMCLLCSYIFIKCLGTKFTQLFGNMSYPLCAYLVISVCDFKNFRERLLVALSQLSAATLITYALYLITGRGVTSVNPYGIKTIYYIFTDFWGRPSAIYQEPGQFQIIIILILVLFVDELVKINLANIKYYVKKFGVIFAILLAIQSTMGYFCMMLLISLLFVFNKSSKHNMLTYVLIAVVGACAVFFMWQSDTVQRKIDLQNMRKASSLLHRLEDAYMLYQMSFVSPVTGLGIHTDDYQRHGALTGGFRYGGGVNGILNVAVWLGWPFLFLLAGLMVIGVGRMQKDIPSLLIVFILLLSLSDETYAIHYLTYLYVFRYNSYD